MKVLIVTNMYPTLDNPQRGSYIKEQVEALQKRGVEIDILNIDIVNNILKYFLGFFFVFFRSFFKKYDIIHAHYGFTGTCSTFRVRTPLITTFHGSDINLKWQRKISKIAHVLGNESIFVSSSIKKVMNTSKGIIIPCGLDMEFFKPYPKLKARKELNIPVDKKVVLFPGSIDDKIKNYPLFKKTILILNDTSIFENILSGHTREEVVKVLSASDVLLMTSLGEGSPVTIKEALACNLPVVSVNVGDVGEIIDGIDGCFICKHDPNELAHAVKMVLSIKNFNAREYVKRYDNSIIANKLIELYNNVK